MDIEEKVPYSDTEILDYMSKHPELFGIRRDYDIFVYTDKKLDKFKAYTDVRKWASSIMEQEQ